MSARLTNFQDVTLCNFIDRQRWKQVSSYKKFGSTTEAHIVTFQMSASSVIGTVSHLILRRFCVLMMITMTIMMMTMNIWYKEVAKVVSGKGYTLVLILVKLDSNIGEIAVNTDSVLWFIQSLSSNFWDIPTYSCEIHQSVPNSSYIKSLTLKFKKSTNR